MRPGYFMCGCKVGESPLGDNNCIDGHPICPIHGRHEYGWRSLPMRVVKPHPFNPEDPQYLVKPDHSQTGKLIGFPLDHDMRPTQ